MYEESQRKLEEQIRENTDLRLRLQEFEIAEQVQLISSTPQPQDLLNANNSMKSKNDQLKYELKAAYCEIAELKQLMAMKDRKIGALQSKNTVLTMEKSEQAQDWAPQQREDRFSLPKVNNASSAELLPEVNSMGLSSGHHSVSNIARHSPPQRHKNKQS